MNSPQPAEEGYITVSDIQVDTVRLGKSGFVLQGRGADRAEYRLEMHLDIPVDKQTKSVVGEMLAQSELRILRRAKAPLHKINRRLRNPAGSDPAPLVDAG